MNIFVFVLPVQMIVFTMTGFHRFLVVVAEMTAFTRATRHFVGVFARYPRSLSPPHLVPFTRVLLLNRK